MAVKVHIKEQGYPPGSRPFYTPRLVVPGIGTAAAYAANDAFGTMGVFTGLPKVGTIQSIFFEDLDDEGIGKTLFLFSAQFTATADNAALALADDALIGATWSGYISIPAANFLDAGAFRIGQVNGLNLDYRAPRGKLYWQFRTEGADNIAAGALPKVGLMIYH